MLLKLLNTSNSNYAAFVSRLLLGVVMFPHGAQKLLGWFGGYGWEGSMNYFTQSVGLPWAIGALVILLESIGALLLILGLASRFVATSMTILTIGIIFTSHADYFFMNWYGNQPTEGFEYFLLMIGLGMSVAISGGGAWSVDSFLSGKYAGRPSLAY